MCDALLKTSWAVCVFYRWLIQYTTILFVEYRLKYILDARRKIAEK